MMKDTKRKSIVDSGIEQSRHERRMWRAGALFEAEASGTRLQGQAGWGLCRSY